MKRLWELLFLAEGTANLGVTQCRKYTTRHVRYRTQALVFASEPRLTDAKRGSTLDVREAAHAATTMTAPSTQIDPTLDLASDAAEPYVAAPRTALCAAKLQPVLRQIETELHRPLRVADMASAVGLSLFHFSREFRRVTGVSPYAYIRRRRIARAGLLLAGSKLPIVEIAHVVGFKTHAHFSGAFLKTVGMTPRTYRLRYGPSGDASPAPAVIHEALHAL